jgi:glyoxylase-like metal-dependent hydrolase (beta-lactamase superfamily II)
MTCGHLTGDFGRLMEGGEGWIRLPVPAYLIEHPKGFALFDSGMHPDCQNDPAVRVGARIAGLFEFDYRPGEEISARLMAISCDPAKIDLLINSHFHFDHVGGNGLVPNATMLVQRSEWEAAMERDIAVPHGFNRRDFDLGHKRLLIEGEHDVFGDGTVVCLPPHGHTPGHQSLRVRLDSGEIVLAADACPGWYTTATPWWLRSTGSPRSRRAAPAFSSGTTPSSGKPCRRPRLPSAERHLTALPCTRGGLTRLSAKTSVRPAQCCDSELGGRR